MATHGCVSYPCPICHASAIQAARTQISVPMVRFIEDAYQINDALQERISTSGVDIPEDVLKLLSDLDHALMEFREDTYFVWT